MRPAQTTFDTLTRRIGLLLDGRPQPPGTHQRNPLAVTGFTLSLVWVAFLLFMFLGIWLLWPETADAILATGFIVCWVLAPALSWLGLRRANSNGQPNKHLAIAGLRIVIGSTALGLVVGAALLLYLLRDGI